MITPLQTLIGPLGKPIKITPLTKMIPDRKDKFSVDKSFHGIIPFNSNMIKPLDLENEFYVVPRTEFRNIVSQEDIEDWSYLLKKFNSFLGNFTKVLNNIRRRNYYKILQLKYEETEIKRRHLKLKEKLLERTAEQGTKAKQKLTDKEKLEKLSQAIALLGIAGIAKGTSPYEDLSNLATGPVHKRGAELAKMLMQKYGLSDYQAAGMVGNFIRESGLIAYNVENSNKVYDAQEPLPPPWGTPRTGYGWAQWTGGRLNTFIEKFLGGGPGKRGRAATTSDNWRMLTFELDGSYKHVIDALKKTTNVTEATLTAEELYEGALIKANDERVNAAKGVLKEMRVTPKAKGSIIIPEIFNYHKVSYDTYNKSNIISNYIADRPTILNMNDYREPLIVIPTRRPIGISILKMLFKEPFNQIEQLILRQKRQQVSNISTNKTYSPSKQYDDQQEKIEDSDDLESQVKNAITETIVSKNLFLSDTKEDKQEKEQTNSFIKLSQQVTVNENIAPIKEDESVKKTFIDTVSQPTEDIFGLEVYILTQDIIVEE